MAERRSPNCICMNTLHAWQLYKTITQYYATNRMFLAEFLKQETFGLQILLSYRIYDLLIGSTGMFELRGSICPHNGPVPDEPYLLPSGCVSLIRIIGVEHCRNATNVKPYMLWISAALAHNGALSQTGCPSLEGNVPLGEIFAFLLGGQTRWQTQPNYVPHNSYA